MFLFPFNIEIRFKFFKTELTILRRENLQMSKANLKFKRFVCHIDPNAKI